MRYWTILLPLLLFTAMPAQAAPTPAEAQRLVRQGAPELALALASPAQAAVHDRAQWLAWESVRWDALSRLGRWQELLQRTRAMQQADGAGLASWYRAQAALALNRNEEAREALAHLLWQGGADAARVREARRQVVRILVSLGRREDAYLALLRFQQDFRPLTSVEAAEFVRELLRIGKDGEALALLPQVGEGGLGLLVRLRAGKIGAEQAATEGRAVLAKNGGGDRWAWAVLARTASAAQDPATRSEALERLLADRDGLGISSEEEGAAALWQAYRDEAVAVGNQYELLEGDDGAWLSLALRLEVENPLAARALFAYLSRQAGDVSLRVDAEIRLALGLLRAGLTRVADQVLPATPELIGRLMDQLRQVSIVNSPRELWYGVGELAHLRGDHARAAECMLNAAGEGADDLATRARARAAENLALAGFVGDARRQCRTVLHGDASTTSKGRE